MPLRHFREFDMQSTACEVCDCTCTPPHSPNQDHNIQSSSFDACDCMHTCQHMCH